MTNLAGHDMESVLGAMHAVADDQPQCFVAYTVKGFGTPLAGHKDNHAGLMNPEQMAAFKKTMGIPDGAVSWRRIATTGKEIGRAHVGTTINKATHGFRVRTDNTKN